MLNRDLQPLLIVQTKVFYEDITYCRPYDISVLKDTFQMFNLNQIHVEKFRQLPIIWNNSFFNTLAVITTALLGVISVRKLTKITGIKFFRWSVELMVLGYSTKQNT